MIKGKKVIALLLTGCLLALAGCGNSSQNTQAPEVETDSSEPVQEETAGEEAPADPAEAIVIQAARPVPDDVSFPEGDSLEDNIWTRLYQSDLGVELNYIWTSPVSQYDQKLNISITSGDLPDIFQVNATQLKQLADDGQLMDLTQVYEQTASAYTKDVMNQDGGNALLSATFDGKLMAVPKMSSGLGNSNVLWIRTDWLDALGMDAPKTMDDVLALARAFTSQDPDGNGQNDTYGLALNKDLWGMFASLEGFFNGFGAYPNMWVETADGTLASGNIQPAMKDALVSLQALYQDGCIDPEFGVKDGFKVSEDVSRGKIGMMYGLFWNMGWLTDAKTADPDMEWKPYAIVGNGSALAQIPFPITTYYVVSAECENPEVLVQMMNLALEKCFGESAEPDKYNVDAQGNPIFEYPLVYSEPPMKNPDAQAAVSKALESGDISKLNAEEKGYYDQIVSYRDGTEENWAVCWGAEMMYGPEGSLAVLNEYMDQGNVYHNRYFGPSTATMTQSEGVLSQTQLQVFTEIIMGGDADKFDQYVTDWNALGGDVITTEVNQWNQER